MTERTISPYLRWQAIFVLFHYLFTVLFFSLPAQARSAGERQTSSALAGPYYVSWQNKTGQTLAALGEQFHFDAKDVARELKQLSHKAKLRSGKEWLLLPYNPATMQGLSVVQLYTLNKDEDPDEVAFRHQLSLEQLNTLNRPYKTTKQLKNLRGQTVLVPAMLTRSPAASASTEAEPVRDQMAQFWGSAQHGSASDAALGLAGSAVNSALTAEVENWLKMGGGKAKATLDTGISGNHHRDIGLDYFYPLMDWNHSTLFTQLSFHRWNERNQFNVGLGYRHDLNDHWMAGGNLFYDRDLSRNHSRLGLGAELWSDRVRTSVNYYHPLSDWRLSRDNNFNDDPLFYDLYERASRGWDISLETALSQHVGVKGTWFQWYGDKVDVTGSRSQASRDPHGLTLGVNWQPVPLLALNAEHSMISGQDDDTHLGLNLNWQFGRTLDQMLDPDAASVVSSLKGARHDFVNRNNNIVLAYQQREKDLHLYFDPASLNVKAGSAPYTHAVKGGRGGFIVYHSNQPDVAQVVSEQVGTVAALKRGEVVISAEEYQDASRKKLYDRAEYRLTIQPGDFAPSVTDVRISGESTIGNTLNGSYTYLDNEGEDEGQTTQRWYRENAPQEVLSTTSQYALTTADVGATLVYEVIPMNKAGLRGQPGSAQQAGPALKLNSLEIVTAVGGGELQSNGQIKFKKGETGTLFLEAMVVDKDGKPVADQPVYWSHSNMSLGKMDGTRQNTSSKGVSLVKFTDITSAGEDVIVASLLPDVGMRALKSTADTESTKSLPVNIIFSSAANVSFINPPQQVSVGAKTDFSVLVTDEEHQPLEEISLQINSAGETTSYKTGKEGKATFSLSAPHSIDPAQWTVAATLTDSNDKGDKAQIDLLADTASAQLTGLIANPQTAVVGAKVQLNATVKDKHGNPVGGAAVTLLSSAVNGAQLATLTTDDQGQARYADYTQMAAQDYYPAAQLDKGAAKETTVTFTADKVKTLELQRNFNGELSADGSKVSWKVTAKDAHNNRVSGAALAWQVSGPRGAITPEQDDVTNDLGEGLVTVTLPTSQGPLKVEVTSGSAQQQDSVTLQPVLMLASLQPSTDKPLVGSKVTMTARVTNLAGEPLENVLVDFTNDHNAQMSEVSGINSDSNGLARATLEIVKGQEQGAAGNYVVTATLPAKPSASKTATVSWQIDSADARVTELTATPDTALVGSKVQLKATVKDRFGNPVNGAQVEFLSAASNGDVLTTVTTNEQGVASWAAYSQTSAQAYKPAARVMGGAAQETTVTFTVDAVASLTLARDFSSDLLADGVSEASWTVTAKDKHNNLVPGAALAWKVTGPAGDIPPQKSDMTGTNGTGQATIILPKKQGALKVEVMSGAVKKEDSVTLQPVLTLKSLEADNPNPVVGQQVTMTALVTNLAGDPLGDVLVDFTNNQNSLMTEQPNVKTDASGVAQALLKIQPGKESGAPGSYQVQATLQAKPQQNKTATLVWQADAAEARVTELKANPTTAVAGGKVQLTATVKDKFDNPVKGAQVEFLTAATSGDVLVKRVSNDQGEVVWDDYRQTEARTYKPAARTVGGVARETAVTFTAATVKTLQLARDFNGDQQADGRSKLSWTATAKDEHGNPVPNAALLWKVTGPAGDIEAQKDDISNASGKGLATIMLPGNSGTLKITVSSGAVQDDDNLALLPVLTLKSFEVSDASPQVGGQITVTAKVTDLAGRLLENVVVDFTNNRNSQMTEKTGIKTNASGIAQASLQIITGQEQGAMGNYNVTATLQDKLSETQTKIVNWQADATNARVTVLKATPATAAVGTSVVLTATVEDQFGNLVKNGRAMVSFYGSKTGTVLGEPVATNEAGEASVDYQQQMPGTYYPVARIGGSTAVDTQVTYTAGAVKTLELQRDFQTNHNGGLLADGSTEASWTVTAKDAWGNLVPDATLSWEVTGPTGKLSPTKDDKTGARGTGKAKVVIPDEQGELTLSVTAGEGSQGDSVTLYPLPTLVSLVANTDKPVVGESVTLTAKVVNQAGKALENALVNFTNDHADVMEELSDVKTNSNGEAQATLKIRSGKEQGAPGSYLVTATVKDTASESKKTTLNWQAAAGQVTSLTANPTSALVGTEIALTATVQDQYGNKVTNAQVSFLSNASGSPLDNPVASNAQGVATLIFKPASAGDYQPAARVGSTGGKETAVSAWGKPSIESVSIAPDGSVEAGTSLTASVQGFVAQGTGEDASLYQWFYRNASKPEWTRIDSGTTKTFNTSAYHVGYEFKVLVTPKGSEQVTQGLPRESNSVSLYGKPTIASVNVTPSGSVRVNNPLSASHSGFNAQGTGTDSSLYQWYYRPTPTADWMAVDRANETRYTPDNIRLGNQVRVGVTPKGSEQEIKGTEIYSDPISVYGIPSIASVSITPAGATEAGALLTATIAGFDAQGSGEDASLYQWFYRSAGKPEWTRIDSGTSKTFNTSTYQVGYEFKVQVTPKGSEQVAQGLPKESNSVSLYGKPTIASVNVTPSGSVRVNNPLSASHSGFNAQGTGTDSSLYQWYYRPTPTADWMAVDRANETHYTPDNVRIGNQVRVGVTPKGSEQEIKGTEIYSDPISVYGIPSIESVSVTPNGNVTVNTRIIATHTGFNAQGTGTDDSGYQWYSLPKGATVWKKIDNAVQKEFTPNSDYAGLGIRVGVTPKGNAQDITGTEKYSDPLTVASNEPPVLDEALIQITYTSRATTVVDGNFWTDFTVTAKQQEKLMPNVPICLQFIDDVIERSYSGKTGSNGTLPAYIKFPPDYLWFFVNLKVRYAYCKDGNPAAADFSKNPWINIYNG